MTHSVKPKPQQSTPIVVNWRTALWGLGTALCWAISPIFIRRGLEGLPSPLLGVTIGMMATALAYGVVILLRREHGLNFSTPLKMLLLQLVAGVLVGLSTWARWIALDLAPVGVVLALGRLSVPVVIILAPLVVGQQLERVTPRVWLGAAFIVGGSLLLTFWS
jgi:uncharacterized membrane protein